MRRPGFDSRKTHSSIAHYGALWSMAGAVWSILEHSGTFWGILEHSGASRKRSESWRRVNGDSGQNIAPTGTRTRTSTLEGLNPALGPSLHRKAFLWSVRVCTSQLVGGWAEVPQGTRRYGSHDFCPKRRLTIAIHNAPECPAGRKYIRGGTGQEMRVWSSG